MLSQKGNTTIVLSIVLIALTAVAWLMLSTRANIGPVAPPSVLSPPIETRSDLDKASRDLDGVNVDSLDHNLNQVLQDAQAI